MIRAIMLKRISQIHSADFFEEENNKKQKIVGLTDHRFSGQGDVIERPKRIGMPTCPML